MKKLVLLIVLWIIFGCSHEKANNKFEALLSKTPMVSDSSICAYALSDMYRVSYDIWRIDTIKYYFEYSTVMDGNIAISNYFNKSDKKYIEEKTYNAAQEWAVHIGKKVIEVDKKEKADLIIVFDFLSGDGRGGASARGDFPPSKGSTTKSLLRMDLADIFTIVKDRDKGKRTYSNIILHEFAHSLASLRHDDEWSVTNPNNKFISLTIDDVVGARIAYGRYEDFLFQNNSYTYINAKTPKKKVTENFTMGELISHCNYPRYANGHFLSRYTINGLQFIRDNYQTPIKVTSTYRDLACNASVGGAKFSQHCSRNAIDFKFIGNNATKVQDMFENDIILKSYVLKELLNMKCRAMGTYPNHSNHIDTRFVGVGNSRAYNTDFIVWAEFLPKNRNAFIEFSDDFARYD